MDRKNTRTISPEDSARIARLKLMDDDLMTTCFNDYIEGAELLLKIILGRDDLKVTEVKTQKALKNLTGRDVWLDIYATDIHGDKYDIEVQRADKGAHQKRARYHSSMIDADMLKPGEDFTDLRESYVIFITENDVLDSRLPIYHINRSVDETQVHFKDGEHIIYVNGSIRTKDTALGKLMSDFYCTEAKDMCYKELSAKVKHYKETLEGRQTMCDIWEEVRNEGLIEGEAKGKAEASVEHALAMIKDGSLSYEKIAEFSGLSVDKVRELAGNRSA